jgi:hypothetical protein
MTDIGRWIDLHEAELHELAERTDTHDETIEPAHDDDPGAIDAVEDTVEEVVRHGGDVLVVPGDSLADVGRIALVTRY